MLTCNAVGLCGGTPGDWLRLFSRLTQADNRKREPVRCATLRHAPTDLPANYILAHYITWLFAIIFKWNGRAARTRRRRRPAAASSLLAYPLRNKAICSNTNCSRLREREREESTLFFFFFFLVLRCNHDEESFEFVLSSSCFIKEFRISLNFFKNRRTMFIWIVISFRNESKMTDSSYCEVYKILWTRGVHYHVCSRIILGEVRLYIRATTLRDKDRPVCTSVITRDECNQCRSIALTPPLFFLFFHPLRFLSRFENFTIFMPIHFGSRSEILFEDGLIHIDDLRVRIVFHSNSRSKNWSAIVRCIKREPRSRGRNVSCLC